MDELFSTSPWIGPAVWALFYALDYLLTIAGARLYARGAHKHVKFEGSYELTPIYQSDVDAKRWVSPVFLTWIVGACAALVFLHWLASDVGYVQAYLVAVGALLLAQPPVQLRHLRNIFLFRLMASGHVIGQISYPRWVTLRLSSVDFFAFAAVYSLLFASTASWIALGGALTCGITGWKHWSQSKTLFPKSESPDAA